MGSSILYIRISRSLALEPPLVLSTDEDKSNFGDSGNLLLCRRVVPVVAPDRGAWLGFALWCLVVSARRRKTQRPLETAEPLARAVHVTSIPEFRSHETRSSVPASAYPHVRLLPGHDWIPFRRDHSQFEFARFVLSVDDILKSSPFIGWMLFVSCLAFSWLYRPIVLLPAYLSAAMFWAFGMHLVQLCTIGFLRHSYDFDLGEGWLFVLLNMTTVIAAIGLVLSTDRCLRILFMPVPMEIHLISPSILLVECGIECFCLWPLTNMERFKPCRAKTSLTVHAIC